jgi:hypothetical protein
MSLSIREFFGDDVVGLIDGFMDGLKRFFFSKEQLHKYWYVPVDNFQFASADFYQMIEKELTARKVPGLHISRVEFSEGGLLSAKREYLRLKRERLVFDICAAPFGTGYFFSFRLIELPLGVRFWHMLIFLFCLAVIYALLAKIAGMLAGILLFLALFGGGVWLLAHPEALGLKDVDATLLKIPVIGPLYELFFRKETYYREDTRLMYLTTVDGITAALVEEVTAAKGVKIVKRFERQSAGRDLFQEKTSSRADSPAATK